MHSPPHTPFVSLVVTGVDQLLDVYGANATSNLGAKVLGMYPAVEYRDEWVRTKTHNSYCDGRSSSLFSLLKQARLSFPHPDVTTPSPLSYCCRLLCITAACTSIASALY